MIKIIVKYECDETGDHACPITSLCDIREKTFTDEFEAIHFLAECTSVTSNIKEVAPHLFLHDLELDDDARKLGEITLRELEEIRINNLYN
jgi:hypothetical protein